MSKGREDTSTKTERKIINDTLEKLGTDKVEGAPEKELWILNWEGYQEDEPCSECYMYNELSNEVYNWGQPTDISGCEGSQPDLKSRMATCPR